MLNGHDNGGHNFCYRLATNMVRHAIDSLTLMVHGMVGGPAPGIMIDIANTDFMKATRFCSIHSIVDSKSRLIHVFQRTIVTGNLSYQYRDTARIRGYVEKDDTLQIGRKRQFDAVGDQSDFL